MCRRANIGAHVARNKTAHDTVSSRGATALARGYGESGEIPRAPRPFLFGFYTGMRRDNLMARRWEFMDRTFLCTAAFP